jgi:hypothetical protein
MWPEGHFNAAVIYGELRDEKAVWHMRDYLELVPNAPDAQAASDQIIIWQDELARAGIIAGKVSGMPGKSVVYVDAIPGKTFPPPPQHPVMELNGLLFQPHILAVQHGTIADFLNSDNAHHNVFWPSVDGDKKAGHNLGTWPKGEKRSFKFDRPGVVPLLCNVHPGMTAYIVVSPTAYFAETDDSGNYGTTKSATFLTVVIP